MADLDGVIWHDGKMVPWRNATTHVLTHSLHYGLAVFEGIRAYSTKKGPAVFRLEEHINRMYNSAKIYMMKIPYEVAEITEACVNVIKENELDSCYVRPIAFYGSEKMGVSPVGATRCTRARSQAVQATYVGHVDTVCTPSSALSLVHGFAPPMSLRA